MVIICFHQYQLWDMGLKRLDYVPHDLPLYNTNKVDLSRQRICEIFLDKENLLDLSRQGEFARSF